MAKHFLADIHEYVHYREAEKHFLGIDSGPKWWLFLEATYTMLYYSLASKWCSFAGHKWQDCGSYYNGDSAADNFYCTRCGKSIHHTYY